MRKLLMVVLMAGCATTADKVVGKQPGRDTDYAMCPLVRRGATVVPDDIAGAASLVVSVIPNEISADLDKDWARQVLRAIADHDEQQRMKGAAPTRLANLPPHTVSVEYTFDGGRLVYRPLNPQALDALRTGVYDRALELPSSCRSRVEGFTVGAR
jgi:hypothetical protein